MKKLIYLQRKNYCSLIIGTKSTHTKVKINRLNNQLSRNGNTNIDVKGCPGKSYGKVSTMTCKSKVASAVIKRFCSSSKPLHQSC